MSSDQEAARGSTLCTPMARAGWRGGERGPRGPGFRGLSAALTQVRFISTYRCPLWLGCDYCGTAKREQVSSSIEASNETPLVAHAKGVV